MNILDTLKCVEIACNNPPKLGTFEVYNQYTETFTINDLANRVISASEKLGKKINKTNIENPRNELEDHYYNPKNEKLKSLGLKEIKIDENFLIKMIEDVSKHKHNINKDIINPTVKWEK